VRVALLHNIISPHVVPLFARLAREPGLELKVFFLAQTDRNRRWHAVIGTSFAYEVLPHWAIRMGRKDLYTYFVNPTVMQTLLRSRFDVLISVGWDSFAAMAGFGLCRVTRKPFVLWSGSTANEPSWRRTVTLPLVKSIVRGSASWIAYGTRARDYLVTLGAIAERVQIAFNTVDVEWFATRADELRPQRENLRRELGLGTGSVVLYVGQLIERKGPQDLLAAHEMLTQSSPGAQLLLVGYGQLEAQLRAQTAERRIPGVHFAGHVGLGDLPRYYAVADALALPSHEEVWGLVLNEAAAAGLPLVTTHVTGAAPDLIQQHVNGRIVAPAAPKQLAEALLEVLARSEEMGRASRAAVAGKTYNQNVAAIVAAVRAAQARASARDSGPGQRRRERPRPSR
jgi:glycosyltransferase involved in cell wall biosynthesis